MTRPAVRPVLSIRPVLALLVASTSPAGEVDFSGVDLFWGLAETLRRDEAPDAGDWDALFATPGYATMKAHDGSDRTLEAMLPLALMPSHAEERERLAAVDDVRAVLVEHLARAVDRREELEALRERLEGRDLLGDALELAGAWLPDEARRAPAPAISFVVLEPDARGYERIVADLAFALDLGDSLTPTLAHEAHHVLRRSITVVPRPPGDFPERDLLTALDNLQAEGVADLVDKGEDYLRSGPSAQQPTQRLLERVHARYVEAYERADETLARMDRILARYAREPAAARELGRELREMLVLGGHPVGFHMAGTVLEAFGRERLVEHVGDPFAFVDDYAEAAARLGGERQVLGDEARAGVQALRAAFRR